MKKFYEIGKNMVVNRCLILFLINIILIVVIGLLRLRFETEWLMYMVFVLIVTGISLIGRLIAEKDLIVWRNRDTLY